MMAVDTDNGNEGYGDDLKIPITGSKTVSKCWPLYQPDMTIMVEKLAMTASKMLKTLQDWRCWPLYQPILAYSASRHL